jgi:hypothetical protein
MNAPRRTRPPPSDEGGAGGTWGPSLYYLAIAVGVVAGALAFLLLSSPSPPAAPVAAAGSSASQPGVPAAGALGAAASAPVRAAAAARSPVSSTPMGNAARTQPVPPPTREAEGDQTDDISVFVNPGEKPTMGEVIDRLHRAGVHSGLGAFPPPGTRPPLVGLAVPEDFPLPEGYVRHYQATDDGQRIEPILMYSPDYQFFDAGGRPIAIPDDRVVPPEHAPPGLPIRRIVIPAPAEPGGTGR